jgi:AmpD protein
MSPATEGVSCGALTIDADGWCAGAIREPAPNCDERPEGAVADLLVIHNISLPPGRFGGGEIADLFCNRLDFTADPYFPQLASLRVSAHFLIDRAGVVTQFVPVHKRAWHAGVSRFRDRERCNDFSIGIEMEGTDFEPFTAAQYNMLAGLTCALARPAPPEASTQRPLRYVTGHQHIAPVRKTDPGPFFDWPAYRARVETFLEESDNRKNGAATPFSPLQFHLCPEEDEKAVPGLAK